MRPSAEAPSVPPFVATLAAAPTALASVAPAVGLQRPEPPPPEAIFAYYRLSQEAGYYANGGPCATLLASRLSDYLDGATCIPVSNCTLGLMVAMRAAFGEPEPGRNHVITPAYTFTATACAIRWAGYEPVFVDVEAAGWHVDPDALASALERFRGTVAGVLSCATFGTAPPAHQRDAWRAACAEHGVPLVLDSAPGFGATDADGLRLGAGADTEVFSFHATKPFAVGEGGLVTTRDAGVAERLGRLINFGMDPRTRISETAGINAKLSELHAATALAMLDRFDRVLERRRALAGEVHAAAGFPALQLGAEGSPWQVFQVALDSESERDAALAAARRLGVDARALHVPLHRHDAFADCPRADGLEVSDDLSRRSITLPMSNSLTRDEVDRIAAVLSPSHATSQVSC